MIPTSEGPLSPAEIIDHLTYSCYRYNRKRSPEITPERWKLVFGEAVDRMEKRLRREEAA